VSLSLRARLTLWFGLMMAISLGVFAVITYTSISSELNANLDASLNQVVSSLDLIIRQQAQEQLEKKQRGGAEKPATDERKSSRRRNSKKLPAELAFLKDSTLTDSVIKPAIKPLDGEGTKSTTNGAVSVDPAWTAIYEHTLLNSRNFMIQIMDSLGNIIWKSNNLGKDSLALPAQLLSSAQDSVASITTLPQSLRGRSEQLPIRIAIARSISLRIAAAYPVDEVQSVIDDFLRTLMLVVPGVLLISVLGGWFLSKASLHPVDEITRSAKEITASNLSRRLPVPKSDDEIRRLSETLNDMISRLESSFGQIRQFTADASHELRTPLTILTGEIELALRSRKKPEEYQDVLSSALQEVLRLSRVVEYLLLLSRADMGQIVVDKEKIDLTEMLADLADAATVLGAPKNIYITYRHTENLIIEGDQAKVYQIFLNLVDNAVKYTPEGGLISITIHRDGGFAEVRVRDTGIGISAEHQKKIFDRFYRVDRARSRELGGAGLGLSIVQWKVEVHGGEIRVESEPGQGSTFIVRLPLLVTAPTTPTTTGSDKPKSSYSFDVTKLLKRSKEAAAKEANGQSNGREAQEEKKRQG
jgi:heavy metal sensor kinase